MRRLIGFSFIASIDVVCQTLIYYNKPLGWIVSILAALGLLYLYRDDFKQKPKIKQAVLLIAIIIICEVAMQIISPVNSANQNAIKQMDYGSMFVLSLILAPICEELMFRKYLITGKVWTDWLLSPIFFALIHTSSGSSVLLYLLLSYGLTYLRNKYNLTTSYIGHLLNNSVAFLLILISK